MLYTSYDDNSKVRCRTHFKHSLSHVSSNNKAASSLGRQSLQTLLHDEKKIENETKNNYACRVNVLFGLREFLLYGRVFRSQEMRGSRSAGRSAEDVIGGVRFAA